MTKRLLLKAALALPMAVSATLLPYPHQAKVQAQQTVHTYTWTLEAYNGQQLVARESFVNTALNDQQAREFVNNKLAVWGQDLQDHRGVRWDLLNAVFVSKD